MRNESYRETYSLTDAVAQEAAFRSGQITEWQPTATLVDRLPGELDKSKYANTPYFATAQVGMNAMMNAQRGGARPWHDVRVQDFIIDPFAGQDYQYQAWFA